ncbi:hypothetical protein PVK06_027642 [Gossypium arboreum]|uniref:Uncharacterized protein n=1 Tax=Gossypium arboreum TaxID=29729 RepID=A0ABR0P0T1_GOSAR|nr:hypothetical protein PVK06_027642 [Gossypium arboreum]
MVGKVAKLDMNTDSRARDRFAWMVVYVSLERPLVSQILINGKTQRVEYEILLMVCFHCGRKSQYGCGEIGGEGENYGPWMLVERKPRQKLSDIAQKNARIQEKDMEGSRFRSLTDWDLNLELISGNVNGLADIQSNKLEGNP